MTLGFIGCGNMATAILSGIITNGCQSAQSIYIYDVYKPACDKLASEYNVHTCSSAADVIKSADCVFLAVKPNVLSSVLTEINFVLEESPALLISIAAGKSLDFIRKGLTHDNRIIRVMPNINAKVGESMSAFCANKQATGSDKALAETLLKSIGKVTELDESYFPLFGVIAGCSPAFVYMFIDSVARAAVKNGMKKSDALSIVAQSVLGSAKAVLEGDEHPWQLIDNVCSPGGTTIEGVVSLQADGFETALQNAVDAALNKDSKL